MRLTKFVHACVLVEDGDTTILFDPGQFSWESSLVNLDDWPQVDFICITHEHFDHFSLPFVEAVIKKFSGAQILSTASVVEQLKKVGMQQVNSESKNDIRLEKLEHDSMAPLNPGPNVENIAIHYKDSISHPGDSHHLTKSGNVLFLPLAGPWGSAINAVRMADDLKPQVIVPIHDWMWNDKWRQTMYERMDHYFAGQNIKFLKPVDGQVIEV